MRIYKGLLEKNSLSINLCFFLNSVGSTLLMPLALLYLAGNEISNKEILYLGTVKFWSFSASYFFVIPVASRMNIKKTIILSILFKCISLLILFLGNNFYFFLLVMTVSGVASAFFSTASKLYIKATSSDVSQSFSARMTVSNAGAALSPLIVSVLVFFDIGFNSSLFFLFFSFLVGFLVAFSLDDCRVDNGAKKVSFSLNELFSYDSAIVIVLSVVFAMLYFTFETVVPLELVQHGYKEFVGPVMLLNTVIIIFGQMPVYRLFTDRLGVVNSLLIFNGGCIALFIPWFSGVSGVSGLFFIVIGVTFLEMFYGAGIDTIITMAEDEKKIALLDGASSIALSIGAAVSAVIYGDSIMFIPLVFTLFLLASFCVFKGNKVASEM